MSNGDTAGFLYVYLFTTIKEFIEHEKLSSSTDDIYLGLFFADPKRKPAHAILEIEAQRPCRRDL